jgi:hypothetical protein
MIMVVFIMILSHSGRKIPRKRGESNGGALYGSSLL